MKDEGLDDDGIDVEVEVAEPEEEVGLREEENEELLQEENDRGEMMMMMEDTAATRIDDVPLTVPNGAVTMSNNVRDLPCYAFLRVMMWWQLSCWCLFMVEFVWVGRMVVSWVFDVCGWVLKERRAREAIEANPFDVEAWTALCNEAQVNAIHSAQRGGLFYFILFY